ncbi:hypothetical protein IE53DRAFT_38774 [Violaceomyces palustris]|uniref:Uncharacterized protein n=1 Tax=Violaceomyces palustris TaxID=1673888 RepID=A0ACD0P169_9BASI|nr:hypothetical protein IE53DRAFT_38774 [Violaceomyces palustris]
MAFVPPSSYHNPTSISAPKPTTATSINGLASTSPSSPCSIGRIGSKPAKDGANRGNSSVSADQPDPIPSGKAFATSLSDFALPSPSSLRTSTAPISIPSSPSRLLTSPDLIGVAMAGGLDSYPLLRRTAASAVVNGNRLRRSSMLGQEVTPFVLDSFEAGESLVEANSDGDGDGSPAPSPGKLADRQQVSLVPPSSNPSSLPKSARQIGFRPVSLKGSHLSPSENSGMEGSSSTIVSGSKFSSNPPSVQDLLPSHHQRRVPSPSPEGVDQNVCRPEKGQGFLDHPSLTSGGETEAWAIAGTTSDDMDEDAGMQVDNPSDAPHRGNVVTPTTPPRNSVNGGSCIPAEGSSDSPGAMIGGRTASGSGGNTPGSAGRTGVVRRAVNRRGNLFPKDKGVLRVAASLQDEKRPEDSEIASEAKLQRRIGEEFPMPRTPRLNRASSPFLGGLFPSPAQRWDDDDDESGLLEGVGFGQGADEIYPSSEEDERDGTFQNSESGGAGVDSDGETEMADGTTASFTGSVPISNNKRTNLWMGFRETKPHTRASPGADKLLRSRTPAGSLSGPGHSFPMDIETSPHTTMISPGPWGRNAKRKMGDERYEPYATSAYKRRAVSPMTLFPSSTLSLNGSVIGGGQHSPSLQASAAFNSANSSNPTSALPTPTPFSMPSPTAPYCLTSISSAANVPGAVAVSTVSTSFGTNQGSSLGYFTHQRGNGGGSGNYGGLKNASSSRATSPATRPSTPINGSSSINGPPGISSVLGSSTSGNQVGGVGGGGGGGLNGPGASPSLLATSAGSSGKMGIGIIQGSGPGYGSGALGLSLSGNSASLVNGLLGKAKAKGIGIGIGRDEDEGEDMDEGVRMMGLG